MTLIYPNPIWISSVKRRKVDADFSGRADDHRHVGSPPPPRVAYAQNLPSSQHTDFTKCM